MQGVTLTTHAHPVQRSRMIRSCASSPPCRLHGDSGKTRRNKQLWSWVRPISCFVSELQKPASAIRTMEFFGAVAFISVISLIHTSLVLVSQLQKPFSQMLEARTLLRGSGLCSSPKQTTLVFAPFFCSA
jgi:hypothetical protein